MGCVKARVKYFRLISRYIHSTLLSRGPCINDNVLIADRVSSKSFRASNRGLKSIRTLLLEKKKKKNLEEFILCRNSRDSRIDGPCKDFINSRFFAPKSGLFFVVVERFKRFVITNNRSSSSFHSVSFYLFFFFF